MNQSFLLEAAKQIRTKNLSKAEFRFELSHKIHRIVGADGKWDKITSKKLSYKFNNGRLTNECEMERKNNFYTLVSLGMRRTYACTLAKLKIIPYQDKGPSLDQCEMIKRVYVLYKDNKALIDDYMTLYPDEFKLPDFTQFEENEISNTISSYLLNFNKCNKLYPYKQEICDAINEVINIPNLSQSEFRFKLSQKSGRLVSLDNWQKIRKYISYQFRKRITCGNVILQKTLDKIPDYISLCRCGMIASDAISFAQASIDQCRIKQLIERYNISASSDERVYRLYQESKKLYDNYAKDHPEFKLPDFTKFTTDSNIFNNQDKEKEHVVVGKSGAKFTHIPTHDEVKKLCEEYEHVIKSTTLTGTHAVEKAGENVNFCHDYFSLKRYIFGHAYIDTCYQDIPTPMYVKSHASQGIKNPEIRRQICTIKLFRKRGFTVSRIAEIFQEHGEKVAVRFIERVYNEVNFTQLGENLSNKEELSIAYQYKEHFPELKAHMRDDLKPSNQ